MKMLISVCDLCRDRDPDNTVPAITTRNVALDGRAPRELEVCQTDAEWLDRLLGGEKTRPSVARQSETWHCPICEDDVRRGGAVLHLWRHTKKGHAPAQPRKCPNCPKRIDDPRGMSRHRQNSHGWDGLAEALAIAEHERLPIKNNGSGRGQARVASAAAAAKR